MSRDHVAAKNAPGPCVPTPPPAPRRPREAGPKGYAAKAAAGLGRGVKGLQGQGAGA